MMRGRVVFGYVVGNVFGARAPVDKELALFDSVSNPMEAHVNSPGAFLLDLAIGKTDGGGVVGFYWCGRLGVTEFFEGNPERACIFCVEKSGSDF